MMFSKLITFVRRLAWPSSQNALQGLLPPDQLRCVLQREPARTDRTGQKFSLLAFTRRDSETAFCTLDFLVKVLKERLRSTDELGWLGEQQIGVVLPGTPAGGAWQVANDVCLRFPDDLPPPICAVYSYPWAGRESVAGQKGAAAHGTGLPALALETLLLQSLPLWKRAVDVAGAALGVLLLLPLFGVLTLAVKLSSPGPVLFKQWRSGRGGKPFLMYKFRSMRVDAELKKNELLALNEQDGPAFKIKNDPRVTTVGRFLRKTSLDELPQLWNVLKGDMSLVGPRPLPCAETEACSGWLRCRLDVTPGLTCIWQVRGRGSVSFVEWVRMDARYIRSRSLWQDLKLLLLTVPVVVLRRGGH
jgi:lipopolysaccharide/colanic/teichoic acid biosynthesis glycosyltransferase